MILNRLIVRLAYQVTFKPSTIQERANVRLNNFDESNIKLANLLVNIAMQIVVLVASMDMSSTTADAFLVCFRTKFSLT